MPPEKIQPQLGKLLKKLRTDRGLTLAKVSQATGYSVQYHWDIENAFRGHKGLPFPLLFKMARYFEIEPEVLLSAVGLTAPPDTERVKRFYNSTRNRARAERIESLVATLKGQIDALDSERAHCSSNAGRLILELRQGIEALDAALFVG